jgi:hypothetical protein
MQAPKQNPGKMGLARGLRITVHKRRALSARVMEKGGLAEMLTLGQYQKGQHRKSS